MSKTSNIKLEEEKKVAFALKTLKIPKENQLLKKSREGQCYNKLKGEFLAELNEFYLHSKYPSKSEMLEFSLKFKEKISKIDNWFKHKRRAEVKKGIMKFERKKVFTNEDTAYLMSEFLKNKKPSLSKYKEIATVLKCDFKSIRNWFTYKRKLVVKIDSFRHKNNANHLISQSNDQNSLEETYDSPSHQNTIKIQEKIEEEKKENDNTNKNSRLLKNLLKFTPPYEKKKTPINPLEEIEKVIKMAFSFKSVGIKEIIEYNDCFKTAAEKLMTINKKLMDYHKFKEQVRIFMNLIKIEK